MLNRHAFRSLLESNCNNNALLFETTMRHMMGLCDRRGNNYVDGMGNRVLRDPVDSKGGKLSRVRPDQIPLRALNESLLGDDHQRSIQMVQPLMRRRELLEGEAAATGRTLLEDNGAGAIGPSAFANVNAWTGVVTGLLEVGILQAYENPAYIADILAPIESSRQIEGRKTVGAARIGDLAEERLPGMPTKRVQFGDRWLTQPRTVENAVSCELLWETVFLDLTGGQISEHGQSVGDWLAYRKEMRVIDSFIGCGQVSGAAGYGTYLFNYKDTSYNPYISGGFYDNDIGSGNELLYIDNILNAEIKFRDMTDPETGTKVLISPNTILVNREKRYTADLLFSGEEAQYRSAPGAASGEQSFRRGPNPIRGKYQVIDSPLVQQRCIAADGLNISATAAGKQWFLFESGPRLHVYIQNQPLTTASVAGQTQVDMVDRNVLLFVKAWERGIPMWKDPRRVVRSRA